MYFKWFEMITKTSWKTGLELKATQTNIPETGILVKQKLCSSIYKGSKRYGRTSENAFGILLSIMCLNVRDSPLITNQLDANT